MDTFFGLDFGTSNSALSVNVGDDVRMIEIDKGSQSPMTLKSVLYFDEDEKELKFGQEAVDAYIENDAYGRYMQSIKSYLPDRIFASTNIGGKSCDIIDLVALVIREIRRRGEDAIGREVKKVVMGRPVVFSDNAEQDILAQERLLAAAKKAGFEDIVFRQEPVAAAFACMKQIGFSKERIILVGDFGGGTSDFAIVRVIPEGNKHAEVLATSGVHVGGNDFDSQIMWERITKYFGRFAKIRSMGGVITGSGSGTEMPSGIMRELCQWHKIPRLRNPRMQSRISEFKYLVEEKDKGLIDNLDNLIEDNYGYMLFRAIESAKIDLSSRDFAKILFSERRLVIDEDLARTDFEEMIAEFVSEINESIDESLSNAGINEADVDVVSLTGGSSLIPCIRGIFSSKFVGSEIIHSDAFTSVAYGLGLQF